MSATTQPHPHTTYREALWFTAMMADNRHPGHQFSFGHYSLGPEVLTEMISDLDEFYNDLDDFMYDAGPHIEAYEAEHGTDRRSTIIDFHLARNRSMVAFPGKGGAGLRTLARAYGPAHVVGVTDGTMVSMVVLTSGKATFVEYAGEHEEEEGKHGSD